MRMNYNLNYRAPVTDVKKSNEHLTIEQLPNLEITCFMHQYENENIPSAFCNFLNQNCTNIAKNTASLLQTRSHSNYFPSYCRINITKQPIKYKDPLIWNRVPSDIKELKKLQKVSKQFETKSIKTKNVVNGAINFVQKILPLCNHFIIFCYYCLYMYLYIYFFSG